MREKHKKAGYPCPKGVGANNQQRDIFLAFISRLWFWRKNEFVSDLTGDISVIDASMKSHKTEAGIHVNVQDRKRWDSGAVGDHPLSKPDIISDDLNNHYSVEVWVNGIHIGLDNQGDDPFLLLDDLNKFVKNGCDIIFCSCRSRGKGPQFIEKIAENKGYALITTAPYTIEIKHDKEEEKAMNELKAVHLMDLI